MARPILWGKLANIGILLSQHCYKSKIRPYLISSIQLRKLCNSHRVQTREKLRSTCESWVTMILNDPQQFRYCY